jgi:uncharacterized membrane protein
MTPLGFGDLVTTLIVVWTAAVVVAAVEVVFFKSRYRLPAHPVLFAASRFICFGCMFTVIGIAQKANNLGLMSFGLYLFTVLMAALAVFTAGACLPRAKT